MFTKPKQNTLAKYIDDNIDIDVSVNKAYKNILFYMPNNGYKNIHILVDNEDIKSFDKVMFRSAEDFQMISTSIAFYLQKTRIPFSDTYNLNLASGGKLLQTMLMQLNNIPTPKTIVYTGNLENLYNYLKENLSTPFIMKDIDSARGENNFLIKSESQYLEIVQKNKDLLFMFQEFIPNSFDFRLVTIDNKVKVVKKRTRIDKNTHLNNHSIGGRVDILSKKGFKKEIKLAEKCAKLYKTEIAGVDIIKSDTDKKLYVLEINRAPQITDDFSRQEIVKYIKKK